uniref:Uncharacterized protein n=1 Tax=Schistosoma japonicum TaxID=6182 RepID=Q5BWA7_SCHJA|nr:unknown [Schistosoma japonicum]
MVIVSPSIVKVTVGVTVFPICRVAHETPVKELGELFLVRANIKKRTMGQEWIHNGLTKTRIQIFKVRSVGCLFDNVTGRKTTYGSSDYISYYQSTYNWIQKT